MSTFFKREQLESKLDKLTDTMESVTVLSQYLLFHRSQAKDTVDTWYEGLKKSSIPRRLGFLHLANDVLQHSKRKGEEYVVAFSQIMPDAISTCLIGAPDGMISKINRLINIWDERRIFNGEVIKVLKSKIPALKQTSSNFQGKEAKKSSSILVGQKGNTDGKKSVAIIVPASYEAPAPFIKSFNTLKGLEKKRLNQGGKMASEIDSSITDETVISGCDRGQAQVLLEKANAALALVKEYSGSMQEEWTIRENVMFEFKKQIKDMENAQTQLNGLKGSISTIENEFLTTKLKLEEKLK
jgi:hypothetical protein